MSNKQIYLSYYTGNKLKIRTAILFIFSFFFFLFSSDFIFAQTKIGINGAVEWEKMEINAVISLDLASSGLKLPSGRTQGEALISSEYFRLIRPGILNLQVDSSSTIADLIRRGEFSLSEAENLALKAKAVPPALSQDFGSLSASYTLGIAGISAALIRHQRAAPVPGTLSPVPAPSYTGIVIIASDYLPVHGQHSAALLRPCLFPKIRDTEMNVIFERNMLGPEISAPARYFNRQNISTRGPSGLSPGITAVVGSRPLKILASGLFGITPTDPIINRDDAMLIISNNENRKLLSQGRVAIILDNSVLKHSISCE